MQLSVRVAVGARRDRVGTTNGCCCISPPNNRRRQQCCWGCWQCASMYADEGPLSLSHLNRHRRRPPLPSMRRVRVRIVTNSSAALGWMPTCCCLFVHVVLGCGVYGGGLRGGQWVVGVLVGYPRVLVKVVSAPSSTLASITEKCRCRHHCAAALHHCTTTAPLRCTNTLHHTTALHHQQQAPYHTTKRTVASNWRFVAPHFIATARPCMISAASGPTLDGVVVAVVVVGKRQAAAAHARV